MRTQYSEHKFFTAATMIFSWIFKPGRCEKFIDSACLIDPGLIILLFRHCPLTEYHSGIHSKPEFKGFGIPGRSKGASHGGNRKLSLYLKKRI